MTQIVFMTWRAYHVCFDSAVLVSVFFVTHEGTKRYSRTSVGVAPRGGDPKTPVREGEGTREPWRRGATGCRRLSRQPLVCGQGLQRGEKLDNDFALAEATACRAARTIFHIPRW